MNFLITLVTRLVLLLAVVAIAGGVGLFLWQKYGPPEIAVVQPHRGEAIEAIHATGTVAPTVMLPIAPKVAGRVAEMLVDEGQEVKAGQRLARLEDKELRASVAEMEARLAFARSELKRTEVLTKRGVATAQGRERNRSEVAALEASLERARVQADNMSLYAPKDGRIIRRDGEIGEFVPVNQPLFFMTCCAPLRIETEVDEEDIPLVKSGLPVLIHADAYPDQVFDGVVGDITPKGDPVARSFRVRIKLTKETPLLIGMTAETNIIAEKRADVMLVPSSAVVGDKVWLVDGDRLKSAKVRIGVIGEKFTEIQDGLKGDEWLIQLPGSGLAEGRKVRPKQPAKP